MSPYVSRGSRRPRGGFLVPVIAAAVLLVAGLGLVRGLLPSLSNPFAAHKVDRSQPVVLKSLVDLQQFRASSANLQVLVDIEKDYRWTPSWVHGERSLLVAAGSVDATVDFSALDAGAVKVSPDRHAVTVTLPRPELGRASIDMQHSYVAARHRGVLDRIGSVVGSPTSDAGLFAAAQGKLQAAAAADPQLLTRAEANTTATIKRLVTALGFDEVNVRFTSR